MGGNDAAEPYALFVEPEVYAGRRKLPGHVRSQIRELLQQLPDTPRPQSSHPLKTDELMLPEATELRRVRLRKWRIVYAIHDAERWVWVLGVRRRPPYDYQDLPEFVKRLGGEQ